MLMIDHVAIPSRDPERAARLLAGLLGAELGRDGAEDEFPCLRLDERVQLLFTLAETDPPAPHHLAFRTSQAVFEAARSGLTAAGIAFGNDPEDLGNGLSSDPLGGHGRIYFQTEDGHLFEICTGVG
jgi:catechol 2,3-dioxygenase-like lactoylglutathione lyase family enzyme